ncbi:TIGR02679 family protein [Reyranella sp.]|uniref:TIGR02679 family protein n=1 Tax=Reyranella sp. TaxID=1929291 RepID=UPI0027176273|nr:TIGR02679 family protein [Reyranella sp.]MDO8974436.1 TIGR02679 family protein [Reyranella sp.]
MSAPPDERLQRLLGGEHLAPLRRRLRRRFEHAPVDGSFPQLRMDNLSEEERAALARLVGRPPGFTRSIQFDLAIADDNLRRSGVASSLRDALERLDGPMTHLATARLQREALWSSVVDGCSHPDLVTLLALPEAIGLLKRLARRDAAVASGLCRSAEAVLRRLPAGAIARSQLAADVLGDAHALDNGQPVATLVLAAWRRHDLLARRSEDEPLVGNADRARDTWAAAGVLVNQLARPALFLNLPVKSAGECGRTGEPTYLSLRSLLRSPPAWDVAGKRIFVCENPNLVAIAADRWGRDCASLVCTDGMPAAAQRTLLSQLTLARARLCYHGDYDWPGLRIANHVMREHGAGPWRFAAVDYVAAVRTASVFTQRLQGTSVVASWDDELADAMGEHGVAIAEEAVAAQLLADLVDH